MRTCAWPTCLSDEDRMQASSQVETYSAFLIWGGAWCAHRMVLEADDVITPESCRSPEVFLGAVIFSSAADMWAIGTVGVSMLCGSTIFWRPATFETDHDGF